MILRSSHVITRFAGSVTIYAGLGSKKEEGVKEEMEDK